MEASNEQTLKIAMTGDIHAFQKLFSEFQPQLKSYLYRLVASRHDAEDIAHDTFIRGFDNVSTFKGKSSFKTWVFQIATNLAYDHLRKYKRWAVDTKEILNSIIQRNKSDSIDLLYGRDQLQKIKPSRQDCDSNFMGT